MQYYVEKQTMSVYTEAEINVEQIEKYVAIPYLPIGSIVLTNKGNYGIVIEAAKYSFISNGKNYILTKYPNKGTHVKLINPIIDLNGKPFTISIHKLTRVGSSLLIPTTINYTEEDTNTNHTIQTFIQRGHIIEDYVPDNTIINYIQL